MAFLSRVKFAAPAWATEAGLRAPTSRFVLHNQTPIMPWRGIPGVPERFKVWVKRDDLSGMEWSGNKIRKLEFLLAEACEAGADCVVTIGALQSNHCRATAAAATAVGLETHLILRTDDPTADAGAEGNMLVNKLVGAHVHLVTPQAYQQHGFQALVDSLVSKLQKQGRKPFGIPAGGSNATGNWGYMSCVEEIASQSADMGVKFDDIVMSCGSGGTLGGIGLANKLSGVAARVHGFAVCDDPDYFHAYLDKHVYSGILPADSTLTSRDCVQLYQAKGDGYSLSTDEELEFIAHVARATGVIMDPVYTGKALLGMVQAMQKTPEVFKGDNVLFVHTGGLFGLFPRHRVVAKHAKGGSCSALEVPSASKL